MKKNMEYPYPQRRRNAAIIGSAAVGTLVAFALVKLDRDFKCEGRQTVNVENNRLEDGSIDPNSHFTVWDSIDEHVDFNPEDVNKQDIVQEIKEMNPNIDFGNIKQWDKIQMPLSCSND